MQINEALNVEPKKLTEEALRDLDELVDTKPAQKWGKKSKKKNAPELEPPGHSIAESSYAPSEAKEVKIKPK